MKYLKKKMIKIQPEKAIKRRVYSLQILASKIYLRTYMTNN